MLNPAFLFFSQNALWATHLWWRPADWPRDPSDPVRVMEEGQDPRGQLVTSQIITHTYSTFTHSSVLELCQLSGWFTVHVCVCVCVCVLVPSSDLGVWISRKSFRGASWFLWKQQSEFCISDTPTFVLAFEKQTHVHLIWFPVPCILHITSHYFLCVCNWHCQTDITCKTNHYDW